MTATSKIAVITGASAGVGRETVRVFAQNGYDVAVIARGDAGLAAAAREVEAFGQRSLALAVDVADFAEVDNAAARIEAELGPIDVWVNNAMTTVFSPLADVAPDDFERALRVTFLGQVWGTMAALQRMRARDAGSIINVGSALAFVGIPLQSAYCASKFACRGFFEATRAELLHDHSGVSLSMVHLPAMNTPQFDWCETTMPTHPQPVPPIYQPEVAARAIFATAVDHKRSRIVGSWNKMLVVMDSFFPGLGNHFASLGAWDSQLTKQPVAPDRPSNLRAPADHERDYGGHGIFDHKARGVKDPSFLITLPKIALTYARALALTLREMADVRRRAEQHRVPHRQATADPHDVDESSKGPDDHGAQDTPAPVESPAEGVESRDDQILDPDAFNAHAAEARRAERTSLDVLENEDEFLLRLFEGVAASRGPSVEDRYAYGNLAKEILRHLAIRQACLVNVGGAISLVPKLRATGTRMVERASERRELLDRVVKMARAVQPVSLREGQDFDHDFERLIEAVRLEVEWELATALPTIRSSRRQRGRAALPKRALRTPPRPDLPEHEGPAVVRARDDRLATAHDVRARRRLSPRLSGVAQYVARPAQNRPRSAPAKASPRSVVGMAPTRPERSDAEQKVAELLRTAKNSLGLSLTFLSRLDGEVQHLEVVESSLPFFHDGQSQPQATSLCQAILDGKLPSVIPNVAKLPDAKRLPAARFPMRIRSYVSVPVSLSDGTLYGTFCAAGFTADKELSKRDRALMEVLASAAATVIEPEVQERRRNEAVRERLEPMFNSDGLRVVLQPIVAFSDGMRVGAEALSRFPAEWNQPPDEVFGEAASIGFGVELELLAVRRALEQLSAISGYLSVNFSPSTLLDGRCAQLLDALPADRVVLELSEHDRVEDYEALTTVLAPYRAAGMRLAIDDVGAGFSSLRHILLTSPDVIKLDRSIVAGVAHDSVLLTLVTALVDFSHGASAAVVAEGVETKEDATVLRAAGVDCAQGWYFARPGTPDQLADSYRVDDLT